MAKLKVNEMFNSIQTEGILTGRPAYFIRLSGCNLKCSFCDTDHEEGSKMSVKKIVKKMQKDSLSRTVILTGGEPMMHDATTELVDKIIRLGWIVQIETNGTVVPKNFPMIPPDKGYRAGLVIVCSPKTKKIHPEILANTSCFKYLIEDGKTGKDGLPKGIAKPPKDAHNRVMLSPMFVDSMDTTQGNIQAAVYNCLKHGYYFTLQYHKFIHIQ